MVRILIADDHPIIRKGVKQILLESSVVDEVGEAPSSREALEAVRTGHWDALILDITMPDMTGLEVLKELKAQHARIPILMLSIHPEEQYGVRALKAGAAGYLTKESIPEKLVFALQKILNGKRYISPSLVEKLAGEIEKNDERPPHETLSDREFQIACLIGSGKTVSEIAAELYLSVKTISTYRSRILDKMKMKHNAELIHYVLDQQLLR
jgi:two-component system, NarL family, invasion response regulator UvrY